MLALAKRPVVVFLIFFSYFFQCACSAATNRTIDDTNGDSVTGEKPVYSPPTPNVWQNANCTGCLVQPDKAKAFDGTWTAATYNPALRSISANLKFKGTGLYVYLILANAVPFATTQTEVTFTLDGKSAGNFRHDPTTSTDLEYNALVFANSSLPNGAHTFSIETAGLDHNVFVAFDYATYTFDDRASANGSPTRQTSNSPPTTTASSPPSQPKTGSKKTANISIGVAIGAVVVLIILLLYCFYHGRHRQRLVINGNTRVSKGTPQMARHQDSQAVSLPVHTNDSSRMSLDQENPPLATTPNRSIHSAPVSRPWHLNIADPPSETILTTLPNGQIVMSAGSVPDTAVPSSNILDPTFIDQTHPASPADPRQQEVRMMRQMELQRQMASIKQEMRELKRVASATSSMKGRRNSGTGRDDENLDDMKEQIRMMKEQIQRLQEQQQSAWAQGYSDDPPPGYSSPTR